MKLKKILSSLSLGLFLINQPACTVNQAIGVAAGAAVGTIVGGQHGTDGAIIGGIVGGLAGFAVGTIVDNEIRDDYGVQYHYHTQYVRHVHETPEFHRPIPEPYSVRGCGHCYRYTYYEETTVVDSYGYSRRTTHISEEYVVENIYDAVESQAFLTQIDPNNSNVVYKASQKWNLPENVTREILSSLYDCYVTEDFSLFARVFPSINAHDLESVTKGQNMTDKLINKASRDLSKIAGQEVDASTFIKLSFKI